MKSLSLFFISLFLITGCMNFNHVDIPEVQINEPTIKPTIGIKVADFKQYYDGKIDYENVVSNEKMGLNCLAGVLNPWKAEKLIKNYKAIEKYKKLPDYTLVLNGHINAGSSIALNILSPLTLFIIPSYKTASFNLSFVLINNNTQEEFIENLNTSFTTWVDLIFLPVFPLFWIRMDNRITDRSMFIYHLFKEKGAF